MNVRVSKVSIMNELHVFENSCKYSNLYELMVGWLAYGA